MKRTFVGVACLAFLIFGIYLGDALRQHGTGVAAAQGGEASAVPQGDQLVRQFENIFRSAVEEVKPAVVWISSETTVKVPGRQFELPRNPFFDDFFRDFGQRFRTPERELKRQSLGSGFIFDKDGYILTNNHVVTGAEKLEVKLEDGRTFGARLAGADPDTDLAVIQLEGDVADLPVARLGDSDRVEIGQWVIAIGNPFGLKHTVSAGIVSAKGRSRLGIAQYESLIQTDAAINPGNSGGPLLNLDGEVIGINTAIYSRTGGYQGIGFAIPSNMALDILEDLKAGREVVRGYLGVTISTLTPEMAEHFDFSGTEGALVNEVLEGTPAAAAGIQAGDIILAWNGKEVRDHAELHRWVAATEPESTATVRIWRAGKEIEVPVTIAKREDEEVSGGWLGLRVQPLTPDAAQQLGRPGLEGVLVAEVSPDSPARRYNVSPGDVILSVNQQRVKSTEDYRRIVSKTSPKTGILLHVLSGSTGRAHFVVIARTR